MSHPSQNLRGRGASSFRCSRCNVNSPNRTAFHQHLRTHTPLQSATTSNAPNKTSEADETARYIAERRKNFPTTDNINKKLKSDEERQERGDVLETRQFGRMKERKATPIRTAESEPIPPVVTTHSNRGAQANATLLERLLATDIRRERNMVLQCIRHIVSNEFYGLDQE